MSTLLVAFKTTLFDMEKDMEIRGHVCLALINYIKCFHSPLVNINR